MDGDKKQIGTRWTRWDKAYSDAKRRVQDGTASEVDTALTGLYEYVLARTLAQASGGGVHDIEEAARTVA